MDILIQEVVGATHPRRQWIWRLVNRKYATTTGYITPESWVEVCDDNAKINIRGATVELWEILLINTCGDLKCARLAIHANRRKLLKTLVTGYLYEYIDTYLDNLETLIYTAVSCDNIKIFKYLHTRHKREYENITAMHGTISNRCSDEIDDNFDHGHILQLGTWAAYDIFWKSILNYAVGLDRCTMVQYIVERLDTQLISTTYTLAQRCNSPRTAMWLMEYQKEVYQEMKRFQR